MKTMNSKTGDLVQTWILREDIHPVEAIKNGSDKSICGDCVHRGPTNNGKFRTCYVQVGQAPSAIYKSFLAGKYPDISSYDIFNDRKVRLGAYGDPAAVPYEIVENIVRNAVRSTGYTHQWRTCDPRFAQVCMASVETFAERQEAILRGYRTFRVMGPQDSLDVGEFGCPAAIENGNRLTCEECMACGGLRLGQLTPVSGSVVIKSHGKSWVPVVLTKNIKGRASETLV